MVTVTIGSDSRAGEEADPQWVTQEINRRRQEGQTVCVRVQIHEDGVAVGLSTLKLLGWRRQRSSSQCQGATSLRSLGTASPEHK